MDTHDFWLHLIATSQAIAPMEHERKDRFCCLTTPVIVAGGFALQWW